MGVKQEEKRKKRKRGEGENKRKRGRKRKKREKKQEPQIPLNKNIVSHSIYFTPHHTPIHIPSSSLPFPTPWNFNIFMHR